MRAFAWFLGVFLLGSAILGCVAYPLYLVAAEIGHWPFHRVAGRVAMLIVALELIWLFRHLRIRSKADFGYGLPQRRFLAESLRWGLVGIGTALIGAAFILGTGLRVIDPAFVATAGALIRVALIGLSSGIAVALLEETVFRGAMHTAIERESGALAAVLLTAPLFAILHFFAKSNIPTSELAWSSGFDLLQRSFAPVSHPMLVLDSFAAYLAIGLLLSLTRALTGNIAVAVGLHAGWVIVLRVMQQITQRSDSDAYGAWLGHFDGLVGYWMLPWAAAIGIALWLLRAQWVPAARAQ
jgi:membrane protease YdiL (CAAX protease family)